MSLYDVIVSAILILVPGTFKQWLCHYVGVARPDMLIRLYGSRVIMKLRMEFYYSYRNPQK
jgi:hypothetical protein